MVDALGFWTPDTLPLHVKTALYLADLLSGTKTRLLIVGGAGSLYMDAAHTQQLVDQPFFPEQYRPLASAQRDQLEAIRKRSDVQWTFISPAAEFEVSQPRTGQYVLAGEEFTTNAEGKSVVSYADYAVAVVDLIANARTFRSACRFADRNAACFGSGHPVRCSTIFLKRLHGPSITRPHNFPD